MKRSHFVFVLLLSGVLFFPAVSSAATNKFDGRFFLQVENSGQLWYVSPGDHLRHKIKSGDDLFMSLTPAIKVIDQAELKKIPLAKVIPPSITNVDSDKDGIADDVEKALGTDPQKADTDNDGHNDKTEILSGYDPLGPGKVVPDKKVMAAYSGRIVTDYMSSVGYVNPADGRRYMFVSDAPALVQKQLSLLAIGIKNSDLYKIPVVTAITPSEKGKIIDCSDDISCMTKAAATCAPAKLKYRSMFLTVTALGTEEIAKGKNGACTVKTTASDFQIFIPANATVKDRSDAATEIASMKENSRSSCVGTIAQVVQRYADMEKGIFSFHSGSDATDQASLNCQVD